MGVDVAVLARRRRWAGVVLVLAVLVGGGAASAAVAVVVGRAEQRDAAQTMDRYTDDVAGAIDDEVVRVTDTLSGLAAGLSAEPAPSAMSFTTMTAGLDKTHLPGGSGVAYVVPATDAQVAATQQKYGVKLNPVGTGMEHMFSIFSRSFDGSPSAAGRDLSQAAEPAEALRIARDSGRITVSHTYVLLKDRTLPVARQQMSFTFAVPVYGRAGGTDENQFRGWVVMGVRGGDLMNQTLQTRARGALEAWLVDLSTGTAKTIASAETGKRLSDTSLTRERTIPVGQRSWLLRAYPTTRLLGTTDRHMATVATAAGIVITLLLTALIGILAGARNRAMTQVDEATAALRLDIACREDTEAKLREREQELRHLAFHDPLTGLANRTLFYERVDHTLRTHLRAGATFAVLFIDLDGFKQVNDTCGHSAGDMVLRDVAARLHECMRASDTIARFGGDEFAVIAEHLANPADAQIAAYRIVRAIEPPVALQDRLVTVTASVGIALNREGDTVDDIVRAADLAMYSAKTNGKGRYVLAGAKA